MDSLKIRLVDDYVSGILDLTDDELFPFELTKGLFDFTTLSRRRGETSTGFLIPSSSNNGQILDHIYATNQDQWKGSWQKINCEILVNDEVVQTGKFKVKKVINRKGLVNYDCEFISNNTVWIEGLQDVFLNDLNFDSTAIPYTIANVKTSHSHTYTDEYVFALINRGQGKFNDQVHPEDLFPDLFLVKVIEKIFAKVGYTVQGSWYTNATIRKMILTFFGKNFRLTKAEMDAEYARGQLSADTMQYTGSQTGQTLLITETNGVVTNWDTSTSPNSDAGSNVSTDQYTIPFNGYYKFNLSATFNTGQQSGLTPRQATANWKVKVTRGTQVTYYDFNGGLRNRTLSGSNAFKSNETATGESPVLNLQTGDIVEMAIEIIPLNNTFRVVHRSSTFFEAILTDKIAEGQTFNINNVLDDSIPVVELLDDIIKIFNLVPRTNDGAKIVYLETFNDFINSIANAEEWTGKVDMSTPLEISKISEDYKRTFEFKLKQDEKNGDLTGRNTQLEDIVGDFTYTLPDTVEEGIETHETKHISATLVGLHKQAVPQGIASGSFPNITYEFPNPVWTATIWSEHSASPPALTTDFAPRILFYNYATQQTSNGTLRKVKWWGDSTLSTTIPYAISQPVILDGVTHAVCSLPIIFENYEGIQGLTERYYSKQLERVEDGLRIRCKMYIDRVDYANITFRKPIYLNVRDFEGYYLVERIEGFKPHKAGLVDVVLISHRDFNGVVIPNKTLDPNVGSGSGTDILISGAVGASNGDESGFQGSSTLRMGNNNQTYQGLNQAALGDNLIAGTSLNQVVMGQFNKVVNDALFVFGNGTQDKRSNSLVVKSNGDILVGGGYEVLSLNDSGEYIPVYTFNGDGQLIKVVSEG